MMDNIIIKPLWLVLVVTAHMVLNDPSKAKTSVIPGILGSNITLTFTFSDPHVIKHKSHVAVYIDTEKKIAECGLSSHCSGSSVLGVEPKNNTVLYHITNLNQNDSKLYWATVFVNTTTKNSNNVQVNVREENKSSTVPPMVTNHAVNEDSGSSASISLSIIPILVISPVVLLVAGLLWVIWCLVRTKDKQPPTQQNSNPTLQETVESTSMSPPSVIYSVLDFPKRSSTVLEINPNDTEYAAVGYLSDKRILHS